MQIRSKNRPYDPTARFCLLFCFFYWRSSPWISINAPWRSFSIDLKFYMWVTDVPTDSHTGFHVSTRPTSRQMEALHPKDNKSKNDILDFGNLIGLSIQTNNCTTVKPYKDISTIGTWTLKPVPWRQMISSFGIARQLWMRRPDEPMGQSGCNLDHDSIKSFSFTTPNGSLLPQSVPR